MTSIKFLSDSNGVPPVVLAVDDHPINRTLLEHQLKLLGLQAAVAENGKAALEKWDQGNFAIIITDCHMPEMDGYTLAREVRRLESEQSRDRIPIIAWTANSDDVDLCQAAGMDDLLAKPAQLEQLSNLLLKYIRHDTDGLAEHNGNQLMQPSTNGESAELPINHAILKKIEPDSAAQNEILHRFFRYIRLDYINLFPLLLKDDFVELENMAHRMRGSCSMVGATRLAACLIQLERAAHQKDKAGMKQAGNTLADAYDQLEAYFIKIGVYKK